MKPSDRIYLYSTNPDGMVEWYCGLGKPWKIEKNPRFAVSIPKTQIEPIRKGLERFTGKVWSRCQGVDRMVAPDFQCQVCGTSWNHDEALHVNDPTSKPFEEINVGSLLRSETHHADFRQQIRLHAYCESCGDTLCGTCLPPKAGRNKGRCKNCRKKSWE